MPLREEALAEAVFVQAAFTEALFVQAAFTAAPIAEPRCAEAYTAERRCAEAYTAELIGVLAWAPQPLERLPSALQQHHLTTMAMAIVSVDISPILLATSSVSEHERARADAGLTPRCINHREPARAPPASRLPIRRPLRSVLRRGVAVVKHIRARKGWRAFSGW